MKRKTYSKRKCQIFSQNSAECQHILRVRAEVTGTLTYLDVRLPGDIRILSVP